MSKPLTLPEGTNEYLIETKFKIIDALTLLDTNSNKEHIIPLLEDALNLINKTEHITAEWKEILFSMANHIA